MENPPNEPIKLVVDSSSVDSKLRNSRPHERIILVVGPLPATCLKPTHHPGNQPVKTAALRPRTSKPKSRTAAGCPYTNLFIHAENRTPNPAPTSTQLPQCANTAGYGRGCVYKMILRRPAHGKKSDLIRRGPSFRRFSKLSTKATREVKSYNSTVHNATAQSKLGGLATIKIKNSPSPPAKRVTHLSLP